VNNKLFKPADYFDPREYLIEFFDERELLLEDLPQHLRDWYFTLDTPMNEAVAETVAAVLGTSPELWMNLDRAWQSRPLEHVAQCKLENAS
jgi:hypothetical protein